MKNFLLLIALFLFSCGGGDAECYYINLDTQEGVNEYGKLRNMSYTETISKYGESYNFSDLGGWMTAQFNQIRVKKKGINMWCVWKGRYESYGSYKSNNRGSFMHCKPKRDLPCPN